MIAPTMPLETGRLLATPAALAALTEAGTTALPYVARHVAGDDGDLGDDDRRANAAARRNGTRVFSAYVLPTGRRLWIITEADRSATTVLLPEDY